jgi:mercuric ion transport protein
MISRRLFGIGVVGSFLAAVCCATPLLTIVLGALGLSAWLGWSDYIIMPALLVFLGITVYALTRSRQAASSACCGVPTRVREQSSRDDSTHARQDKNVSRDHT